MTHPRKRVLLRCCHFLLRFLRRLLGGGVSHDCCCGGSLLLLLLLVEFLLLLLLLLHQLLLLRLLQLLLQMLSLLEQVLLHDRLLSALGEKKFAFAVAMRTSNFLHLPRLSAPPPLPQQRAFCIGKDAFTFSLCQLHTKHKQ